MKARLLRYLVCPSCQGRLALARQDALDRAGEIREGLLACAVCPGRFPVHRGVPRFPIAGSQGAQRLSARTRRTYNFAWKRFGRRGVEQQWEKDSYRYLALVPRDLLAGAGRLGLDAGCGAGQDLLRLAAGGAEVIGVDLSDGVDVAAELTRSLPNVHVVQADLHALPFAAQTFDFVYSLGVLHHLPDPVTGMAALARVLKPGAPLVTYLYEDFSDRTLLERALLALSRAARRLTSRMPQPALYLLCWAITPVIWLLCALPAHALRRWPAAHARLPFRHTRRWPVLASDLFDRLSPPLEWRFSRRRVEQLYAQAGCQGPEIRWYRGWVSWGSRSGMPEMIAAQATA